MHNFAVTSMRTNSDMASFEAIGCLTTGINDDALKQIKALHSIKGGTCLISVLGGTAVPHDRPYPRLQAIKVMAGLVLSVWDQIAAIDSLNLIAR